MIEAEGLTKEFRRNVSSPSLLRRVFARPKTVPVRAIDNLDLRVERGQFFSLLGPNGAGKTSTVRVLCTLLLPDSGTCRVAGFDVVTDARTVRRNIGVSIRGERSVYWKLTARQNLEYFASLYGLRGGPAAARIKEVAEVVGLADRLDDYVERYSMGMKQRLAIGASLIHRPPVIILDEPTIGLDPNGARALRDLLKTLCKRDGVTILYTTHHMQEAEELSDRLMIIDHGRKVIEGTPAQVRGSVGDNLVVEMEFARDAATAVEALKDHPAVDEILAHDRHQTGDTVRLRTCEPLESLSVLASVSGTDGAGLRSMRLVQPTLEDVFVSLTGSTITEAGDAKQL